MEAQAAPWSIAQGVQACQISRLVFVAAVDVGHVRIQPDHRDASATGHVEAAVDPTEPGEVHGQVQAGAGADQVLDLLVRLAASDLR